jgi:hypothetical protein
VFNASSASEIDAAFATMRERRVGALLVGGDPFLSSRTQQIVALAARDATPALIGEIPRTNNPKELTRIHRIMENLG